MQGFEGFLVVYCCFLAKEGLDEGVEFGVLLPVEFGCAGTQFFLERCFRIGFLELGIETGTLQLDGIVMLEEYRGKNAERTGLSRGNHALLYA